MRTRLSPTAKLAAGVGVLLALATSQQDLVPNVSDAEELGAVALDEGTMVYVSGSSSAGTISLLLTGENAVSSPGRLKLWRVSGPFEAALPGDATLVAGASVPGSTESEAQHLDVELEDENHGARGDFAYALVLTGAAVIEGDLLIEACCWAQEEEEDGDLQIDAFEVIPAEEAP